MEKDMRRLGIEVITDVPWGTHLCQFYETKEDLIDILVPYFKAGLENNEFCLWITSAPLETQEAKTSLKKVLKNVDEYIEKGQIEILDTGQWYTKSGKFEPNRVLEGWVEKEKQAVKRGFDGLRFTGNTFWLEKKDWRDFADYEATVDNVIGEYRMLAICSYSLNKCGASELIDVVNNHRFALIKREGKWELLESARQRWTEEAVREQMHELGERVKELNCLYGISNLVEKRGTSLEELLQGTVNLIPPTWQYPEITCARIILEGREFKTENFRETIWRQASDIVVHDERIGAVEVCYLEERPESDEGPFLREERSLLDAIAERLGRIIERVRAEEVLRESEEKYRNLVERANDGIAIVQEGVCKYINPRLAEIIDCSVEELIGTPFTEHIHPSEIPKLTDRYKRRMAGEEIPPVYETVIKLKDGSDVHVEINASIITCRGKPADFVIIRDITERKRAEEELRKHREHLEELVQERTSELTTANEQNCKEKSTSTSGRRRL